MNTRKNYRAKKVNILHIISGDTLDIITTARNEKIILEDACYAYWVDHHNCCDRKCSGCCWERNNKNPIAEYEFTWL